MKVKMASVVFISVAVSAGSYAAGMGNGRGDGDNLPRMASYETFDMNSDGMITREEFEKVRTERVRERTEEGTMMRNMDQAPAFEALDRNRDGVITREEYMLHQQKRMTDNRTQKNQSQRGGMQMGNGGSGKNK